MAPTCVRNVATLTTAEIMEMFPNDHEWTDEHYWDRYNTERRMGPVDYLEFYAMYGQWPPGIDLGALNLDWQLLIKIGNPYENECLNDKYFDSDEEEEIERECNEISARLDRDIAEWNRQQANQDVVDETRRPAMSDTNANVDGSNISGTELFRPINDDDIDNIDNDNHRIDETIIVNNGRIFRAGTSSLSDISTEAIVNFVLFWILRLRENITFDDAAETHRGTSAVRSWDSEWETHRMVVFGLILRTKTKGNTTVIGVTRVWTKERWKRVIKGMAHIVSTVGMTRAYMAMSSANYINANVLGTLYRAALEIRN